MADKRAKLLNRASDGRAGAGNRVRIAGTCQAGTRAAEDVLVTDVDEHGCELRLVSMGVTKGAPFVVCIGEEGPFAGRLAWVRQGSLGITFDAPMEPAVLQRLLALAPPSNVVALPRAASS